MTDARLVWIWLANACGQGSKIARTLLTAFASPEDIYKADRDKLTKNIVLPDAVIARLEDKDMTEAETIVARCDEIGATILTPRNVEYPRSLMMLRDPPLVLYVLGTMPNTEQYFACAVVGTRSMTAYGRRIAYDMGRGLAAGGSVLVSGLALGIDGMSMAGALDAGGITVGVLGGGVDNLYPADHKELARRVMQNGAVISEYPPGTPSEGHHFPVRNRIISGLAAATVVVEGDLKSGSLITARHALYQGKTLYAVPGPVGELTSEGPNRLIKEGAKPAMNALDILDDYAFLYADTLSVQRAECELRTEQTEALLERAVAKSGIGTGGGRRQYGTGIAGGSKQTAKQISSKKASKQFVNAAATAQQPPTAKEKIEPPPHHQPLNEQEKKILNAMQPNVPILADDIRVSGMTISDILATLTILELSGEVDCGAGGYYCRHATEDYFTAISDEAD